MNSLKIQSSKRFLFAQLLDGAIGRRLLTLNPSWKTPRLPASNFEVRQSPSDEQSAKTNTDILRQFRANLRRADDMIGKLDYGLREIFRANH